MNNIKLNNFEAIALVLIVTITHSILTLPKALMTHIGSASLLNILYVSILTFVICIIIYKLLNKFPGFDILDISEFLGGKLFKRIIGFAFLAYIIFVSSFLLRIFAHCLNIVYYPMTDIIFILIIFILSIPITSSLNSGTAFRANIVIIPIVLISMLFLFISNTKNYNFQNIYPLFGYGVNSTFFYGATNIFAFGGITIIYFLPPLLKNTEQLKKVSILSVVLSTIYLILTIATILFTFSSVSFTNELIPLYSAVRYIEFGTFFQRLDSVFLLIWIITFFCYLGVVNTFCINIYKKITNIKEHKLICYPFSLLLLALSLIPKNESLTYFLEDTIYRYVFLFFSVGICTCILIFAYIKKISKIQKE